jgi:Protein of unknown function (DUF3467)
MAEDQASTTILKEEDIQRSDAFRSYYSNHTTFNVSAFDFALTFGEILNAVDGHLYVDQKVRVVMSPLHAKILAHIMSSNIATFEKQFGEIKIPVQGISESIPTPPEANAG